MERITSNRCKFIIDEFKLNNDTKIIGAWGIGSYGDTGKWEEWGYDESRLRKLGLKCSGGGQWGNFNGMKLETYFFPDNIAKFIDYTKDDADHLSIVIEYKDTHYNILAYKMDVRQRVERTRKLRKINESR